ncbi:MAG TPA: hypothetical protein PKJ41_21690 [Bryobacteraceae bacterium]|nr:hypothetical protein [Bryobacteraceae bacterium]
MSNESEGCGCLLMLCGISLLLLIAYPIYDGYVNRGLPEDAQKAIHGRANIYNGDKNAYLSIMISNDSEWILGNSTARVTINLLNGRSVEYSGSVVSWKEEELNIAPNEQGRWCSLRFPEELIQTVRAVGYKDFSWSLVEPRGRRVPIKLVKRPIDWCSGLFERDTPKHAHGS